MKKMFQLYDGEKTGFISEKNLKDIVKDIGINVTDQDISKMIERADLNKDGVVSEEEFYLLMSKK